MTIDNLFTILLTDKPSLLIRQLESQIFELIPELKSCKGFEQHSSWHIYDVYEHTLHVVDNVEPDLILRLSALFHDIGKPLTFHLDEKGEGHFYGHYAKSMEIFNAFAQSYNLDFKMTQEISKLIYYHDLNLAKLDEQEFTRIKSSFDIEGINKLYLLKQADLLAHSSKYHYLLPVIENEQKLVLKKYD